MQIILTEEEYRTLVPRAKIKPALDQLEKDMVDWLHNLSGGFTLSTDLVRARSSLVAIMVRLNRELEGLKV